MILEVGQKMLESLGYQVLKARSGKEALEVYQQQGDRIDLMVMGTTPWLPMDGNQTSGSSLMLLPYSALTHGTKRMHIRIAAHHRGRPLA